MKYVTIIAVALGLFIIGGAGYALFSWGSNRCEARHAQATTQVVVSHAEEVKKVQAVVDAADDCSIKRLLCKTARGGCDPERVCDSPDGAGDNATRAALDGIIAPDSKK